MKAVSLPEIEIFAVLASTGLCPNLPGPDIVVSIQHHEVEIRNDLTRAQLQELRGDIDLAYQTQDHSHGEISGMLRGDIGFKYRLNFDQVPHKPGGGVCIRYRRVHVILELGPVIFVAREYAPPGCLYREIYQHEATHLAVDKSIIEKYAQRMRDGLAMAFSLPGDSVAGPVDVGAVPALKKDMGNAVMGMTNILMQDLARERVERQAAIDAPENYTRVLRRCYFDWPALR